MRISRLNSNIFKLLACLFMLCDHIGFILFPKVVLLRIIGRLAFPIFAFFIEEGCKYTKNKLRYLLQILILGLLFMLVQLIATKVVFFNVFLTFAASIALIYLLYYAKINLLGREHNVKIGVLYLSAFIVAVALLCVFCHFYQIDYGFWGLMLPVFFSLLDFYKLDVPNWLKKLDTIYFKLLLGAICLVLVTLTSNLYYQWVSLFSLLLLALYNGERGKYNIKYFFYAFYPVHIVILYLISYLF